MAKYAAKDEPYSNVILPIFKSCIDHHGNNNNTYKALQGVILCCVDKHEEYSRNSICYSIYYC